MQDHIGTGMQDPTSKFIGGNKSAMFLSVMPLVWCIRTSSLSLALALALSLSLSLSLSQSLPLADATHRVLIQISCNVHTSIQCFATNFFGVCACAVFVLVCACVCTTLCNTLQHTSSCRKKILIKHRARTIENITHLVECATSVCFE